MIRAAIYARVSTDDQSLDGQLRELRAFAAGRGWEVAEFSETVSGAADVRPVHDEVVRRAKAREFGVVLVWALDRWSRAVRFDGAIREVLDLEDAGVRFVALNDPGVSTPDDGSRDLGRSLLLALLPTIAAWERKRIRDRIQVAMDDIKAGRRGTRTGRAPGRPCKVTPELVARIHELRSRDPPVPWAVVAQTLHVPAASARKWARRAPVPATPA